jgi:hypothetical protein
MSGDVTENQLPVVQFVNVPLDSSQFSFAPTVYWFGYDPDGFVTAYQYNDDQSDAAVAAYDSDRVHPGALLAYINSRPAESWVTSENTQETIYLLTTEGDTTQHVFIVRSIDNHGATSQPRVRTFFRTNQAPNTPEIKKTPTDNWDTEQEYSDSFVVADTLYVADEPGATWPGIQFVWRGTDPDSRELNIIPLEFSYLLTNVSTNQVVPFPRIIDSTQVEWVHDWSDWSDAAQLVLSETMTNGEMETGSYKLELRVQDDGKTLSDTNAVALFYAIRPTFAHQLLIVDENKPLSGVEPIRGGYSDSLILAFYHGILPEAFDLANRVRPFIDDDFDGIPDIPEPFDSTDVGWFSNKNMENSIPFDLIHQFKWVWIIDDDNPQLLSPGLNNIEARQKAMGRYMDVGGQVMLSGRRIFAGSYGIPVGTDVNLCASTNTYGRFFCTYFNLQTANCKAQFNSSNDVADFGGANTASALLPDIRIDSSVVCSLRFGSTHYCCLPEIDYFGRSTGSSGYNFSETVYNYSSCTANLPFEMTNVDGEVLSATPTQAILSPDTANTPAGRRHTRILSVSRVYNVTRGVSGEVMDIRFENNQWQIVVSTPADPDSGAWVQSNVLQIDYTYIPTSINQDKPVGARFVRIEGKLEVNQQTGEFHFIGIQRFRSAIYTFPLSFLDRTPVNLPGYGDATPAAAIIATQMIYFNSLRRVEVRNGG